MLFHGRSLAWDVGLWTGGRPCCGVWVERLEDQTPHKPTASDSWDGMPPPRAREGGRTPVETLWKCEKPPRFQTLGATHLVSATSQAMEGTLSCPKYFGLPRYLLGQLTH
ncbi:hypothetical protein GCM10023191_102210 [Actinoallomurus oryzae]|uniref:Uncharacterized protein n=1 Tax=Actinoallomurus oryzae TaxID=502180 RepID=A0ABP8R9P4_9ACTN